MAQFDNNDFTKYDYYKRPNIEPHHNWHTADFIGEPDVRVITSPSIAKQMEDLATELNMAFENVAALNVALGPIMSSEPDIVRERPMEKDSTSEYFQRMRGFVVKTKIGRAHV